MAICDGVRAPVMTSCLERKTGVQGGLKHAIRLKTWKVQSGSGEKQRMNSQSELLKKFEMGDDG